MSGDARNVDVNGETEKHDDIGATTGDAMNKELRRHQWQSGSRGRAGVSAAGSSFGTPGRR
ncbi:MAG: hypothetical protein ACXWJO_04080, partial [Xanthobacteraceae bacterium]